MVTEHDRVWVVAPHADDEVLGLGGLLTRAATLGAEIHILFATCAGYAPLRGGLKVDHRTRRDEAEGVMRALGATGADYYPGGDDCHLLLDSVPQHDLIEWLESGSTSSLAAVRPTRIFIPTYGDTHQDHRALHQAALTAARVNGATAADFCSICSYEVPGSGAGPAGRFQPTIYVELTESEIARKEELFRMYASQLSASLGGRDPRAIRILAAARGLEIGRPYAEAFELIRATHGLP